MTHPQRMLLIALLTIAGLLGGPVLARADRDNERCEKRVHQAEEKLRLAVERHGENSPQAHKRHEQLEDVRRQCHRDRDHDRDHDQH